MTDSPDEARGAARSSRSRLRSERLRLPGGNPVCERGDDPVCERGDNPVSVRRVTGGFGACAALRVETRSARICHTVYYIDNSHRQ
ncbi:hypothetical protein GCM10009060_09740 [Halorubrum trapanicum]